MPTRTPALNDQDEVAACLPSGSPSVSSIAPIKSRWKGWNSKTHSTKSSRQPAILPHSWRVLASATDEKGDDVARPIARRYNARSGSLTSRTVLRATSTKTRRAPSRGCRR